MAISTCKKSMYAGLLWVNKKVSFESITGLLPYQAVSFACSFVVKKTLQYKNLPIGLPISSHLMHGTLWYVLGWNRMWRALMVGFRAWITGV